jgi:hypothetical protein
MRAERAASVGRVAGIELQPRASRKMCPMSKARVRRSSWRMPSCSSIASCAGCSWGGSERAHLHTAALALLDVCACELTHVCDRIPCAVLGQLRRAAATAPGTRFAIAPVDAAAACGELVRAACRRCTGELADFAAVDYHRELGRSGASRIRSTGGDVRHPRPLDERGGLLRGGLGDPGGGSRGDRVGGGQSDRPGGGQSDRWNWSNHAGLGDQGAAKLIARGSRVAAPVGARP